MATPKLTLDELVSGQDVPETTVNENVRWLEFFASGGGIIDRDLATPPGSPSDGDAYLIASSATGAWSGHDGEVALRISTAWEFKDPIEGMPLYVNDENLMIVYNGSSWVSAASGSVSYASAAEIRTGTEAAKAIAPDQLTASHAPQTLTDGATVTWNMNSGFNAKVTLGGNRTLAVSNPKVGLTYVLEVIQDATGSRTVTWPASFNWGAAGAPTLSTGANKVDLVTLYCRDAATPKFRAIFSKDA